MITTVHREDVQVGTLALPGELCVPDDASGLVLFAHGSGSSRLSQRNRQVAELLHCHGLATLLFDLLTEAEADDRRNVFDIDLLGGRVGQALVWAEARGDLAGMPAGVFGASTGAAAALLAAARWPSRVAAVVSRGGRPDLAAQWLARVAAPALLIVGGADIEVLELNRRAMRLLQGVKRLEIVPGASHLFEEPGALQSVAALAAGWFEVHLSRKRHG
jgi:pimeloyl-ACP methyl ester carboxylesterase